MLPSRDRCVDAGAIVAERGFQPLEKCNARSNRERCVESQDLARERHTGGFTAAGQKVLAQFDEVLRTLVRRFAALNKRATTIRDRLQHVAEERGTHRSSPSA